MKELKAHLQDFFIMHPNITYEEIVDFFGTPEDIVRNYIEFEGVEKVNKRNIIRKYLRITICVVSMSLFFVLGIFFFYWVKGYSRYSTNVPTHGEIYIEEGVIEP